MDTTSWPVSSPSQRCTCQRSSNLLLWHGQRNRDNSRRQSCWPIGTILAQKDLVTGDRSIIAYASKSLSETEQRYSQTEREALAVVWGCEYFHLYVYGKPVTVCTDHKPLISIYAWQPEIETIGTYWTMGTAITAVPSHRDLQERRKQLCRLHVSPPIKINDDHNPTSKSCRRICKLHHPDVDTQSRKDRRDKRF